MEEPSARSFESLSKSNLCFHCNSIIPPNTNYHLKRDGETHEFCCHGCKTVSQIILESGNTKFYDIRGSQVIPPVQTPEEDRRIREEYLNGDLVREEYIREIEPGKWEVHITITNIHCSACIWLNEKVLNETAGILYSRINFATGRAQIHYDPNRVSLSEIFQIIESIGYLPRLYSPWKSENSVRTNKSLLIRMGIAGFCFGNIMLFGISLYAGYFSGMEQEWKRLLHWLSWLLATPVYFYSGYPFIRGAIQGLKQKRLSMDFLLVAGVSLAYFYSIYVTLTDRGEVYFDSVCMIYFFILLGKYLEDNARIRAGDKLTGLLAGLPELATVLLPRVNSSAGTIEPTGSSKEEWEEKVLRTSEIKKEMLVLIRNGERIPVDGILQDEIAYLDESFLTGESDSITKKIGDKILAGSVNSGNPIQIVAESDSKNSTLSRLKVLIEQAMGEKPKMERITDRISTYFIITVFFVALGTFFSWFYGMGVGLEESLINTIAVLIVACPCALGLAVPTALVMNHIRNSRAGVVIKNPDSIESISRLDTLFLDKTGTITEGKPRLVGYHFSQSSQALPSSQSIQPTQFPILQGALTVAIEKFSTHPLAKNLVREIQAQDWYPKTDPVGIPTRDVAEVPGKGMEGKVEYKGKLYEVRLGSSRFLQMEESTDKNRIHLSANGEYLGYWEMEDQLRKNSREAIVDLQSMIPRLVLLSGDQKQVVEKTAVAVGIKSFRSEVSPEDKLETIREEQSHHRITAMVGDGINDSAALAKADIGVSMGVAADLSLDKSDIILVQNDLATLGLAIHYAKETHKTIRQNMIISFLYNSIMLPLAAFGFMAPVICAVFMALSSLTVVGNSLRLKS